MNGNRINTRLSVKEKLHKFQIYLKARGYDVIQINGQRIYAPLPNLKLPTPPKGCEVFIGNIKKSLMEYDLIPLFERIAPLFQFRLMMSFDDKNRGFAYATYLNKSDAATAITYLDNFEISPGCHLAVKKSVDNCRLTIDNIPIDKTEAEVFDALSKQMEGVESVTLIRDNDNILLNAGFAYVEFQSHRLASLAKRQFFPSNLFVFGVWLDVDWAEPSHDCIEPLFLLEVKSLFLSNLPSECTTKQIRSAINKQLRSQIRIKKFYHQAHFAFVHFHTRDSAEIAWEKLQGFKINGNILKVDWARPTRYALGRYTSVPFRKSNLRCEPNPTTFY